MYYECHITVDNPQNQPALSGLKRAVEGQFWTFSRIAGDPILGLATYCYATRHFAAARKLEHVALEMSVVAQALKLQGYTIVRQKVELVVLDTKEKE